MENEKETVTGTRAAKMLRLSDQRIYTLKNKGKLAGPAGGGIWLDSVNEYATSRGLKRGPDRPRKVAAKVVPAASTKAPETSLRDVDADAFVVKAGRLLPVYFLD